MATGIPPVKEGDGLNCTCIQLTEKEKRRGVILERADCLVMYRSVACALAVEVVVAAVERIEVDTAQALAAAVAELRRPLCAAVACLHCLVERAETTSLDLFTSLRLQILMCAVLGVRIPESCWMMRWIWMIARSRVWISMGRSRMVLWIGVRVGLGLRLGFHVDSAGKNSRPVIVYF